MKRLWLEYVRDILDKKNGVRPKTNVPKKPDLSLRFSDNGFPLLPEGLNPETIGKKSGVRLLREYLKEHHCMFNILS